MLSLNTFSNRSNLSINSFPITGVMVVLSFRMRLIGAGAGHVTLLFLSTTFCGREISCIVGATRLIMVLVLAAN
ncbi:hypothetical protein D3C80_2123360 [compost metagenome]